MTLETPHTTSARSLRGLGRRLHQGQGSQVTDGRLETGVAANARRSLASLLPAPGEARDAPVRLDGRLYHRQGAKVRDRRLETRVAAKARRSKANLLLAPGEVGEATVRGDGRLQHRRLEMWVAGKARRPETNLLPVPGVSGGAGMNLPQGQEYPSITPPMTGLIPTQTDLLVVQCLCTRIGSPTVWCSSWKKNGTFYDGDGKVAGTSFGSRRAAIIPPVGGGIFGPQRAISPEAPRPRWSSLNLLRREKLGKNLSPCPSRNLENLT